MSDVVTLKLASGEEVEVEVNEPEVQARISQMRWLAADALC